MACRAPVEIVNPNWEKHPWETRYIAVPCGQCLECKQSRSRQWIFRLKEEAKSASSAFFITLTYDEENVVDNGLGEPTLYKKDFQNFIKRIRHETPEKVKYLAAGEYGDQFTERPHYHAIIFNSTKEAISKHWNNGFIHIGTVTEGSIAYVLKYIIKEVDDVGEDQEAPFLLMSKGLGQSYIENDSVKRFFKKNLPTYIQDEKGFKYPIPRYYREKLFNEEEKKIVDRKKRDWIKLLPPIEDFKKELEEKEHKQYLHNNRLKKKKNESLNLGAKAYPKGID